MKLTALVGALTVSAGIWIAGFQITAHFRQAQVLHLEPADPVTVSAMRQRRPVFPYSVVPGGIRLDDCKLPPRSRPKRRRANVAEEKFYQPTDNLKWIHDLIEAGWTEVGPSIWKHPDGRVYLGPYGAWKVQQIVKQLTGGVKRIGGGR